MVDEELGRVPQASKVACVYCWGQEAAGVLEGWVDPGVLEHSA